LKGEQLAKVKLIAESRFFHDGKRLSVGEEFEADAEEAADLVALKRAIRPKGLIAEATQTIRRTYNRRDMKAGH
jgi:hypothetical protein